MSPEQARGASETDVRSDIYSCGVILFESVTGRLPFEGESFNDLMFKIALSDAPSVLEHVPTLDPAFAAIVGRAVARDPNARFPTAQDFADALDAWMRNNQLTDSLSATRPSDAFPASAASRTPSGGGGPGADKGVPTLALDDEIESIGLGKTSTDESWARSGAETPVKQPARGRRAVVAMGAVAVVGLALGMAAIAGVARTHPSPPLPAVSPTTGASVGVAEPSSQPPSSSGRSGPAPASSAELAQVLAPIATGSVDSATPPTPAHRKGGAAPPARAQTPANAGAPTRPKAAPASSGFDLGY
jgi:serine/threonine-protein kinase